MKLIITNNYLPKSYPPIKIVVLYNRHRVGTSKLSSIILYDYKILRTTYTRYIHTNAKCNAECTKITLFTNQLTCDGRRLTIDGRFSIIIIYIFISFFPSNDSDGRRRQVIPIIILFYNGTMIIFGFGRFGYFSQRRQSTQ